MSNHKDQLTGLYAITDEALIPESFFNKIIESALKGGVKIIQYRDKSSNTKKRLRQANALCLLCKQYDAISIINDDIELAKTVGADGVHIGRDDNSVETARQTLGGNAIIGVSCYGDLALAKQAEQNGADYVAFGAMFTSPTKPMATVTGMSIIAQAKSQLSVPICTIGGITEQNIQQVVESGSDMTAVISSLFSKDDITYTAKSLSQYFH